MSEIAYISIPEENWLSDTKKLNFNLTVLFLSFAMMLFHFASVYFFTFQLESVALVWVFLGLWNFFAFLFDVPVWILQYYFKYKTLIIVSVIAQILAMMIFANFIFWLSSVLAENVVSWAWNGIVSSALDIFLWWWLNLILLLLASILYGFSREVQDITLLSYVLNKANPSQYNSIMASKNLFWWIGSLLWLIISWFILTFTPSIIIVNILIIIWIITYVTFKFFDNDNKVLNMSDIKNFKVYFEKDSLENTKKNMIQTVRNIDLNEVISSTKYIFIKPIVKKEKTISLSELIEKTKLSFIDIYNTLIYAKTASLVVYWSFSIVLTFGFWDTFAATFLIDYLDQVKAWWSYILLAIIAIPAFWLQDFFSKLAEKIWLYFITNIGLAISWASLFFMAFFPPENMLMVMSLALLNSVWYAITMSLSQAVFLEAYNKVYADKNNLKQIDANASAAPMKILQNLANVFWLVFGSIILFVFWYTWFFAVFWLFILWFLWWSLMSEKKLKL